MVFPPTPVSPPATKTKPFGSNVAVWLARADAMLATTDHVFATGS
jgi:hypothetical protein